MAHTMGDPPRGMGGDGFEWYTVAENVPMGSQLEIHITTRIQGFTWQQEPCRKWQICDCGDDCLMWRMSIDGLAIYLLHEWSSLHSVHPQSTSHWQYIFSFWKCQHLSPCPRIQKNAVARQICSTEHMVLVSVLSWSAVENLPDLPFSHGVSDDRTPFSRRAENYTCCYRKLLDNLPCCRQPYLCILSKTLALSLKRLLEWAF